MATKEHRGLVHTFLGRQQGSWKLEAESGLAMGWTLAGEHVQRSGGRRETGRWRSHCCWCDWSVRARGRGLLEGGLLHPDPRTHGRWTEEAEGGMFKFAVWKDQIFSTAKIWVL